MCVYFFFMASPLFDLYSHEEKDVKEEEEEGK